MYRARNPISRCKSFMPSACSESAGPPPKSGILRDRRPRALVVIALYKFVKMAACVLLAATAFNLVRPEVAMHFEHWLESLTWATRYGIVTRLINWLLGLGPTQFRIFGVAAIGYAALYAVQGVGLWLGKRWAEYLVVIETCLLLPFDSWELLHRFSALKLAVLVANVVVVVYLIRLLRRHAQKTAD